MRVLKYKSIYNYTIIQKHNNTKIQKYRKKNQTKSVNRAVSGTGHPQGFLQADKQQDRTITIHHN